MICSMPLLRTRRVNFLNLLQKGHIPNSKKKNCKKQNTKVKQSTKRFNRFCSLHYINFVYSQFKNKYPSVPHATVTISLYLLAKYIEFLKEVMLLSLSIS